MSSGMEERFGSGSTASTQQVDQSTLVNESQPGQWFKSDLVNNGSGLVTFRVSWF
ncbi:hypothetical protein Hanom_Chr09g00809901 [Helianthus anomalus]